MWYIFISGTAPTSVVGRSTTHRPSGVGPQVGLGGLESQRRAGQSGHQRCHSPPTQMRAPGFESLNHQGRERSAATGALAPEAVWQREPLTGFDGTTDGGPQAPGRRQRPPACARGRRPPGSGPARPVTRLIRRINANGRRPCTDAPPPAQSLAVWPPNKPTMSAPAAGTAASWAPDTRRTGFIPAAVWRNSVQVEQAEGLPRSGGSKSGVAGPAGHTAFDDGATQQRSCGRRQDARTANMAESEEKPRHVTDGIRALHFWGGGPESAGFCDRPGPGMALEQNPFLPPTRPGGANEKRCLNGPTEQLNITSRCITRSLQYVGTGLNGQRLDAIRRSTSLPARSYTMLRYVMMRILALTVIRSTKTARALLHLPWEAGRD